LKVAVLTSGGVDSSLALALLKAAGHQVHAFYLKIWFQEDFRNFWSQCPWEDDLDHVHKARSCPLPSCQRNTHRGICTPAAHHSALRAVHPLVLIRCPWQLLPNPTECFSVTYEIVHTMPTPHYAEELCLAEHTSSHNPSKLTK
jgi:tRNA methyl transferase